MRKQNNQIEKSNQPEKMYSVDYNGVWDILSPQLKEKFGAAITETEDRKCVFHGMEQLPDYFDIDYSLTRIPILCKSLKTIMNKTWKERKENSSNSLMEEFEEFVILFHAISDLTDKVQLALSKSLESEEYRKYLMK